MNHFYRLFRTLSNVEHLINGHKHFRDKFFQGPNKNLYENLVKNGQSPKIMVISCSDSRVDPSIIFDSTPGAMFVVRNVGALVPPCDQNPKHHGTSAALQFAVQTLEVEDIIILGHSHCGGIRSLVNASPLPTHLSEKSFILSWMNIAEDARKEALLKGKNRSLEDQAKICEERSIVISLSNLRTFSWINEKVNKKTLLLHGWRFDMLTGAIQAYNSKLDKFEKLVEHENNLFPLSRSYP